MKVYSSKLLLFGEYTIIKGSSALAIPLKKYSGSWTFSGEKNDSNQNLRKWCDYLMQQKFDFPVQLDRFSSDIQNGLTFQSNIPQGYGVGSSGSLVAAFAHEYVTILQASYSKKNNISFLKNALIQLENYFHGGGSGIDPLVCFLNCPLIFQKNSDLKIISTDFLEKKDGQSACFLINTHQSRKTEPLVSIFHQNCEQPNFDALCKNELAIYNNNAIHSLLKNDKDSLFNQLKNISNFQYEYFQPMILEKHFDIWKKGINSHLYYLKLCGAGGGGFILGFTQDWQATQVALNEFDLELIFKL